MILIALLAIIGTATAEVRSVKILSPQEDEFNVGDPIWIDSLVTGDNVGYKYVRTLVNNVEIDECGWIPTAAGWVPTEAGTYTIKVEAADNAQFNKSKWAAVTINVK